MMTQKNPANLWRKSATITQNLGKVGKVVAFTTIHSAPSGYEHQVPYSVGIIKFEDGTSSSLEIVDTASKNIKIGLKVQTVVRRIGQSEPEELIDYGIKVKPARNASPTSNASRSDAGWPLR
jgi:uncharacterized OB-fold protein